MLPLLDPSRLKNKRGFQAFGRRVCLAAPADERIFPGSGSQTRLPRHPTDSAYATAAGFRRIKTALLSFK